MSFLSSIFGSNATATDNLKVLAPEEYKKAIESGKVQLIDVRTPSEFHQGHLPGAVNIDYFKRKDFADSFEKIDKAKPVYLYCRSGQRSHMAAKSLIKMGFQEVIDLKGGLMRWPY